MSPDSRIGAVTPRLLASVRETSTCVSFLTGPRTDIFWLPFVPTTSTFSSQANCPGWLNIFFTVSSWPLPNRISRCSCDKCTCLADVSTNTFILKSSTFYNNEIISLTFNYSPFQKLVNAYPRISCRDFCIFQDTKTEREAALWHHSLPLSVSFAS